MSTERDFLRPGKTDAVEALALMKNLDQWVDEVAQLPDYLQSGKFLLFGDYMVVGRGDLLHRDMYHAALSEISPFRSRALQGVEAARQPRLVGSLVNDAGFVAIRSVNLLQIYGESQDFGRATDDDRAATIAAARASQTRFEVSPSTD